MQQRQFAFAMLVTVLSLLVSGPVHGQETFTQAEAGQYLVIPIPEDADGRGTFSTVAFVWSGDPGVFTRAMVDSRGAMVAETSPDVVRFDPQGRLIVDGQGTQERTIALITSGAEASAELMRSVGANPVLEWGRHVPNNAAPEWLMWYDDAPGVDNQMSASVPTGRLSKWGLVQVAAGGQNLGGGGLEVTTETESGRDSVSEVRFTNIETRLTNLETMVAERLTNLETMVAELVARVPDNGERDER